MGKAEAAGSPHIGVVLIAKRVHGSLPCKDLPLALKLYLGGLQVHLLSLQVILLPLEVGRTATGTLVWWHEPRHLLDKNLTINVVAHAWRGAVINIIGVVL
jgi:hypothetical protein